jgi:hypothetical protein
MREYALKRIEILGNPLVKVPGAGQLYTMPDGSRVRLRTSRDRRLIVTTDGARSDAKLDFEDSEYVLLAMPQIGDADGVDAYLIPSRDAAAAIRSAQQAWLDTGPRTSGTNCTWYLAFDEDALPLHGGYAATWRSFRLDGSEIGSQLMAD